MNSHVCKSSLQRNWRRDFWQNPLPYAPVIFLFFITITGCGGGAPGSAMLPASSTVASVSVACVPSAVTTGATSQCKATVQGTGSDASAVTWSASGGAINSSGLLTAPAVPGTVTVTAASAQDPSKSDTAIVMARLISTPISAVVVNCNPATVTVGATSQCDATVQGTGSYSSAVTWSASGGTVDSNGLVTVPASAGLVTVSATSAQDAAQSGKAAVTARLVTPQSHHVVMVMEENRDYSAVVGDTGAWPNLNRLIKKGALPTHYYANTHPTIGNLFMLTAGQLLTTNDSSTRVWNVPSIARRLLAAHMSFKIYAESVPRGYVGGNTGLYLVRHNPFAKLSDIADNKQVAYAHLAPFTQFATDVANGALPEFSFIVPNVDDDGHNASSQRADSWLQTKVVDLLSRRPAFEPRGDGVLIVDFDEAATSDRTHGGGHVSPVFWGPKVKVGYRQTSKTIYQQQSMLRTVMEALRLSNPPGAAANAPLMSEFFVQK